MCFSHFLSPSRSPALVLPLVPALALCPSPRNLGDQVFQTAYLQDGEEPPKPYTILSEKKLHCAKSMRYLWGFFELENCLKISFHALHINTGLNDFSVLFKPWVSVFKVSMVVQINYVGREAQGQFL